MQKYRVNSYIQHRKSKLRKVYHTTFGTRKVVTFLWLISVPRNSEKYLISDQTIFLKDFMFQYIVENSMFDTLQELLGPLCRCICLPNPSLQANTKRSW